MKHPNPQPITDATDWRRLAYHYSQTMPRLAGMIHVHAQTVEAEEPREWLPAGTVPIRDLLKSV